MFLSVLIVWDRRHCESQHNQRITLSPEEKSNRGKVRTVQETLTRLYVFMHFLILLRYPVYGIFDILLKFFILTVQYLLFGPFFVVVVFFFNSVAHDCTIIITVRLGPER